ncbi:MAG: VWA domain-containing protein [Planctomycetota bacterium]|nr:VWA domain-containing protein [Planctomycetota bacterium]
MSPRLLSTLLLLAVVAVGSARAEAGIVLIPGEFKDGKLSVPKTAEVQSRRGLPTPFAYHTTLSRNDVTVENNVVKVKRTESLETIGETKSLVGLISLPETVVIDSVKVTIGDEAAEFKALDANSAQKVLENIARELKSVTILSLTGRPAVLLPSVKLKSNLTVTIEYSQSVKQVQGVRFLNVPMPAVRWTGRSLDRLLISVDIRAKQPIRAVLSPTHETAIERPEHQSASIHVKAQHVIDDQDTDDLGLRLLTHKAPDDESGYFLLIGNPTGQPNEKAIEKDVTFVLDTSGSMRGEKLEQCRVAIEYCLENLNPGDRFNIVTFGSKIESFRDSVVSSTEKNVAAAQTFVEELVSNGRTNIDGALKAATQGQHDATRPQIAIFLTDGTPTAGELVDDKILENFKKTNQAGLRVFVLGVGNEVNAHLLDQLAEVSSGQSEYVAPDEEIDQKIAGLYNQLANPVMTDVKVAFGELQSHSVFPRKVPALFRNSQVMLFGRFRDEAKGTVELTGKLADQQRRYAAKIESTDGSDCEFIAPLWASRKIGYLLQEIRLHGEEQELINEVVRLSKKYGIVTEYTQSLALAGGILLRDHASLTSDAFRELTAARQMKTGAWAVNQAKNDRLLQSRIVSSNAGNNFLDRRGQTVSASDALKQVGNRAYYYRNGVWQDGTEVGKRKTRTVKAFSKEYFDLLRNPDFAKAQQLGGAVSLNIGNERVVVEPVPGARVPAGQTLQGAPDQQLRQINGRGLRDLNRLNQIPFQQRIQLPQIQQQIPGFRLQVKPPQPKPAARPAAPKAGVPKEEKKEPVPK